MESSLDGVFSDNRTALGNIIIAKHYVIGRFTINDCV
jgi:hypothetical protein